jgi:hypothetical protein
MIISERTFNNWKADAVFSVPFHDASGQQGTFLTRYCRWLTLALRRPRTACRVFHGLASDLPVRSCRAIGINLPVRIVRHVRIRPLRPHRLRFGSIRKSASADCVHFSSCALGRAGAQLTGQSALPPFHQHPFVRAPSIPCCRSGSASRSNRCSLQSPLDRSSVRLGVNVRTGCSAILGLLVRYRSSHLPPSFLHLRSSPAPLAEGLHVANGGGGNHIAAGETCCVTAIQRTRINW